MEHREVDITQPCFVCGGAVDGDELDFMWDDDGGHWAHARHGLARINNEGDRLQPGEIEPV